MHKTIEIYEGMLKCDRDRIDLKLIEEFMIDSYYVNDILSDREDKKIRLTIEVIE